MPIIEEYGAIAKRLRELQSPAPKGVNEIRDLERWRDLAKETARAYLENRRRGVVAGSAKAYRHAPQS